LRVLLAQSPLLPVGEVTPHVGLCTLASWLNHAGHEVRVLDLDLEIKGVDDPHRRYIEIFARAVKDFSPQFVGMTSMYNNSLQAEQLVRTAKNIDSGIVTIAGGSHFGALGERSLRRIPELDYAIEGESEPALLVLLAGTPPAEIPRLFYRSNGEIRGNPSRGLMDLATLPPMWSTLGESVSLARYAATISGASPRRIAYIEAGRGCPFACTFCATAPFWEQRYRVKPVHRIVDEIRYLHEEFNYDSFILVHDLLTANSKFMSAFCDAMLDARLPVQWMANSRTDLPMRGLLPKMKAAGCWKLFYGVESASSRIQKEIDKHLTSEQTFETIQQLTDHGISATTSFVMGFPTETAAELSASIAMGARLKLMGVETVQFHRLRLFPPSRLSRTLLSGEFDGESLRIEYPFIQVPPEDIEAIKSDKDFFAGYWTPMTSAGSKEQLAQVEMFFHHVVALAPLTIAAAGQFAGDALIPAFYKTLDRLQPLKREKLDWETGDLFGNWIELGPLLNGWIGEELGLREWQGAMVRALVTYEGQRIGFVSGKSIQDYLVRGENWAAFHSDVDLPGVLACLQKGVALAPDLLLPTTVVLTRRGADRFAAYTVDEERVPDLMAGRGDLMSAFQN